MPLMDIKQLHSDIHSTLPTDPIASIHLKSKKSDLWWSLNSNGLLWRDNHIYMPDSEDLQFQVLCYKHNHPTTGHFRQNKTINLVWCEYTWPRLCDFVKDFCKSCTSCYCAKTPCYRPYRSLKQLPIPEKSWNSISMDFIEQLPASSGYMAILVAIDRLTKQSIFIPTHDTISLPNFLSSMYSPSTEFYPTSPLIEVWRSSPTSSGLWVKPWTWHSTSPPDITQISPIRQRTD